MAKKPKLFHAFTGDAVGLRNELMKHFRDKADAIGLVKGSDYGAGIDAGKSSAYSEVAYFLKKLVINNDELPDDDTKDE